jgi:hypothetical protein
MSQSEGDGDRGMGTPDQTPMQHSGLRPPVGSVTPQWCDKNCTDQVRGCASLREQLAWDRILALHRKGQAHADPAEVPQATDPWQ